MVKTGGKLTMRENRVNKSGSQQVKQMYSSGVDGEATSSRAGAGSRQVAHLGSEAIERRLIQFGILYGIATCEFLPQEYH